MHILYRRKALLQFLFIGQWFGEYLHKLLKRLLFRKRIECNRLHELFHLLQLRNQLRILVHALSPLRKRDDGKYLTDRMYQRQNPRRIRRFI